MKRFIHDIRIGGDANFNAVAGLFHDTSPDRRRSVKNRQALRAIEELENSIRFLEPVYAELDTCYVYVAFSSRCNLACTYCFESGVEVAPDGSCVPKLIQSIEALRTRYCGAKVVLYGGEPFLPENARMIEQVLSYCSNVGLPVRVITNGVLLNEFHDLILDHGCCCELTITLDGSRAIHDSRRPFENGAGTYDLIVKNVRELLGRKACEVGIRVNLDRTNIDCQSDFIGDLSSQIADSMISVTYHRTRDNWTVWKSDSILSFREYADVMDRLVKLDTSQVHVKSGDNVYTHIRELLESGRSVYPRLTYCEYGYVYMLCCDNNVYTCEEGLYRDSFRLCTLDELIADPGKYVSSQRQRATNVLRLQGCSACPVGVICGGGCELARKNGTQCEKDDIIWAIRDMCMRRSLPQVQVE